MIIGRLFSGALAVLDVTDSDKRLPIMLNIPSIPGMITALHWEEDSNRISLGFNTGAIASVILDFENLTNQSNQWVVPEYIMSPHDCEVEWIAGNKSINILASVDAHNTIYTHSLTNGTFLNRIELCQELDQIQAIWLNQNGYITFSGKEYTL